ncbi:MAG TPA: hypothetical protein VK826_00940 [Bacteroidia bacterium]|nr:hypothetical protein [Bacteroidia bacterium]
MAHTRYTLTVEEGEFGDASGELPDLCIADFEQDGRSCDRTTMIRVADARGAGTSIRIDWFSMRSIDPGVQTLTISATNMLFFGARYFWGVIDLGSLTVVRREKCDEFFSFEQFPGAVVIITEYQAQSLSFSGESIHAVDIDVPAHYTLVDGGVKILCLHSDPEILKLKK